MSAVAIPVTGAVAVYCAGEKRLRLPIVGLDDNDHALVLSHAGKVTLATRARPKIGSSVYSFACVEVAS